MSFIGFLITTNVNIYPFSYNDNNNIESYIDNPGLGGFNILEIFYTANNKQYIIYGYIYGTNYNHFNLRQLVARGDVIVIAIDSISQLPVNAVLEDLYYHYTPMYNDISSMMTMSIIDEEEYDSDNFGSIDYF